MIVSVHLEIVLILVQVRCTVCDHTLGNRCWMHPMDLQGDVGHVESRFYLFGDSVSVTVR
jgi:hypothetical protein